jgi:low affinity Fe/Cu permease
MFAIDRDFSKAWHLVLFTSNVILGAVNLATAYFFQNLEDDDGNRDYLHMIDKLTRMGSTLSELKGFLQEKQAKISQIQATIVQLNKEKRQLEPVVKTQREVVEAILCAHSRKTRSDVWKDRLFGFSVGIASSLVASFLFQLFWSHR